MSTVEMYRRLAMLGYTPAQVARLEPAECEILARAIGLT